jgi:hypothetical protein
MEHCAAHEGQLERSIEHEAQLTNLAVNSAKIETVVEGLAEEVKTLGNRVTSIETSMKIYIGIASAVSLATLGAVVWLVQWLVSNAVHVVK